MTSIKTLENMGVLRVKLALAVNKSLRKTAKILGTTHVTLAKFCRKHRIPYLKMDESRTLALKTMARKQRDAKNAIDKYIEEHKDVKLPRSMTKIAAIVGCSPNAVRLHFFHRRRKLRTRLSKLPNIVTAQPDLFLQETSGPGNGTIIRLSDITWYSYRIDPFAMTVDIIADVAGKRAVYAIPDLEDFIRRITSQSL